MCTEVWKVLEEVLVYREPPLYIGAGVPLLSPVVDRRAGCKARLRYGASLAHRSAFRFAAAGLLAALLLLPPTQLQWYALFLRP